MPLHLSLCFLKQAEKTARVLIQICKGKINDWEKIFQIHKWWSKSYFVLFIQVPIIIIMTVTMGLHEHCGEMCVTSYITKASNTSLAMKCQIRACALSFFRFCLPSTQFMIVVIALFIVQVVLGGVGFFLLDDVHSEMSDIVRKAVVYYRVDNNFSRDEDMNNLQIEVCAAIY